MSDTKPELISIEIDGQKVEVPPGTMLIRAAEMIGINIPRFCDHPLLDPVAACRQCLVDVDGARKPVTACSEAVRPDMVVRTQHASELARTMQRDILELILVNHPLDCPQCDKAGECPLQDQAYEVGHPDTKMAERKRTYTKGMPINPLITLDRERCVLCARCTRFSNQISGDIFIELLERGALEQVAAYEGSPYTSHFSGNVTQICPVGALTSTTYRFGARPFDLKRIEGIAFHDASGANIRYDIRAGAIQRIMARTNMNVNESWIDDKTRYAFAFIDNDKRLVTPLRKDENGKLAQTSWLDSVRKIGKAIQDTTPERVGFIAGGRLPDEDAYALSRFARSVVKTDNVDYRANPSTEETALMPSILKAKPVVNSDIDASKIVVIAGIDPHEEAPNLFLRLRKNWRKRNQKIVVVGPVLGSLEEIAWQWIPTAPGQEAVALKALVNGNAEMLSPVVGEFNDSLVVIAGERLKESPEALATAQELANKHEGSFLWVPLHPGSKGAIEAGLIPGTLPGGRALAAGSSDDIASAWGALPAQPGMDTTQMLQAAADGKLDVLWIFNENILETYADTALVAKAIETCPMVIVAATMRTNTVLAADLVLPVTAPPERVGSYTNWEGRRQEWPQAIGTYGAVLPEWDIVRQVARVMDSDFGWESIHDVRQEAVTLLNVIDEPQASTAVGSEQNAPAPSEGLHVVYVPQLLQGDDLTEGATELMAAGPGPYALINPADAQGLVSGDTTELRAINSNAKAEINVVISPSVLQGVIAVPTSFRRKLEGTRALNVAGVMEVQDAR